VRLDGHRADHGQAQLAAERSRLHSQPAALGQIDHVERHDARQAQPLDRQHQAQVAPQVGGIDHADHQVRALLALRAPLQHIDGDRLIQ